MNQIGSIFNPLISVIIPVYNAENFIKTTLDSLINQSFILFEVIMINDGSTDNSIAKINKIIKGDSRFKLISQENSGPGAARNYGISLAKTDYISFIDSDDYFEKDFLKNMYNTAIDQNADIVVCDFDKVTTEGIIIKEYKHYYNNSIGNIEAFIDIMQSNNLTSLSQNKIFKRILFNDVSYPTGIVINEDVATIYRLILKANKIAFLNQKLFHYVQMPGSSMNNFNHKKLKDRLLVSKMIKKNLIKENLLPKYKYAYNVYYLLNVILSGSIQICKYSSNWSKNIKKFLNNIDCEIFVLKNILLLWKHHKKKMLALIILKTNIFLFKKLTFYLKG